MLKETAPAVSIVCNTSKLQGTLWGFVKEGQTHRHKEAACILGVGEIRGANAPLALAGVFRLNQALLKTGFPNFFGSVKYFLSEL